MKRTYNLIAVCLSLQLLFLWGCMKDEGNYDYDFDNVPEISLDSASVSDAYNYMLYTPWNLGDEISIPMKVNYPYPEDLEYYWLVMDAKYQAETIGNAQVYPPADTICRTLDLNYKVALDAGKRYQLRLQVKDTVRELGYTATISYNFTVPEAGSIGGVYCLHEKDGKLDIDIFGTPVGMIYSYKSSNNFRVQNYWSQTHPDHPLKGTKGSIYYSSSKSWFYIFTDEEGFRCSPANLTIMDTWDKMFYTAPEYGPEAFRDLNSCDFLINKGKLHCLYYSGGDRKFQNAVSGDYDLMPALATNTITSWGAVAGAIGAYQVVFDKRQNAFRPFFNRGVTLGNFNESIASATFDVNKLKGEPVYVAPCNSGEMLAIMKRDGCYWADVAMFYNLVDNGNLARYSVSLGQCEAIEDATCFRTTNNGGIFFYGAGNTIYSFAYNTGQKEASKLWTGDAGDKILCMEVVMGGGWPTGGKVLWAGVWNESTKEGKIVEIEFSTSTGKVDNMWGPRFGGQATPQVYTGYGKILSICAYK